MAIGILLATYFLPNGIPQASAQSTDVLSEVSALHLNAGENGARVGIMDAEDGYAYFGTWTNPGIVVKINLSSFTESGSLKLNTGEIGLSCAVIDRAAGFAYFGTYSAPE